MDKNTFFIALIVFIVVFGGILLVKTFQEKPVLTIINNTQ